VPVDGGFNAVRPREPVRLALGLVQLLPGVVTLEGPELLDVVAEGLREVLVELAAASDLEGGPRERG
jgi:hypothetical protein